MTAPTQLERLEQWVDEISFGYHATAAIAAIDANPDRYANDQWALLRAPLIEWQPAAWAAGRPRPVTVQCDFPAGLYPTGFQQWVPYTTNQGAGWYELAATDTFDIVPLRQHLTRLAVAGDTAMRHTIEWSVKPRTTATTAAFRRINSDQATPAMHTLVIDALAAVVEDRMLCYAGVPRYDTRGKLLAGRPNVDVLCAIKTAVATRATRFACRELGINERIAGRPAE